MNLSATSNGEGNQQAHLVPYIHCTYLSPNRFRKYFRKDSGFLFFGCIAIACSTTMTLSTAAMEAIATAHLNLIGQSGCHHGNPHEVEHIHRTVN